MEYMEEVKVSRHTGRLAQMWIYLGKLFRMFIFQSDWKVLPMSAIIAGLVSFAVGRNMFKTMEGTAMGTFALSCVCIWNGFFNSIQSVCRERAIVKREHRSGLHITSYVAAHMIYQAVLCLGQAVIIIIVCNVMGVVFPTKYLTFPVPYLDFVISLFLTTYAADMLALFISSVSRTTTGAMTVMPFLLIIQLVFSGGFFDLPQNVMPLTNLTISKWGLTVLCSQGDYNSLPMTSVWNNVLKMKDVEIEGEKPILELMVKIEKDGRKEEVLMKTAAYNQKEEYRFDPAVVNECWGWLALWIVVYVLLTVISLEMIDRDKR